MAGQFDAWLAQLAVAGKGPVRWRAGRFVDFSASVTLAGDWTGAAMRGQVRAAPDAAGILASFTIAAPVLANGKTTFTLSIPKATVTALPADTDGDGSTVLVYDILLDPAGAAAEDLLFGGEFVVIGGATQ